MRDGGKLLETSCLTTIIFMPWNNTLLATEPLNCVLNVMLHAFYHNTNKWVKKLTAGVNFTKDSLLNQVLQNFVFY